MTPTAGILNAVSGTISENDEDLIHMGRETPLGLVSELSFLRPD